MLHGQRALRLWPELIALFELLFVNLVKGVGSCSKYESTNKGWAM